MIREEILEPLELTAAELAEQISVGAEELEDVVAECIPLSAEVAQRLADHFNLARSYWLTLQDKWDGTLVSLETGERITSHDPWIASAEP